MKKALLLFAALLVAGCGEKSLSDSAIKKALEEAVELDFLQVRGDLYYQPYKWKPYSGWVKETYDDSEQAEELFEVQNGKQEGRYIKWDEDGHKSSEGTYKDGEPDGRQTWWHENGQKMGERTYKDGKELSAKYWNRKGEEVETREEARK